MTTDNDQQKKPLTLSKKLTLGDVLPPKSGSNKTIIEVKKSKTPKLAPKTKLQETRSSGSRMRGMQMGGQAPRSKALSPEERILQKKSADIQAGDLSLEEKEARLKALRESMASLEQERQEEQQRLEREKEEALRLSEEKQRLLEEEQRAREDAEKQAHLQKSLKENEGTLSVSPEAGDFPPKPSHKPEPKHLNHGRAHPAKAADLDEEDESAGKGGKKRPGKVAVKGKKEENRRVISRMEAPRRMGKVNINQALDGADDVRMRSQAALRRAREKERKKMMGEQQPAQKMARQVVLPETITVQELANRMAERAADVIKTLMAMGTMATINHVLDADTAELVANELGHTVKRVTEDDLENDLLAQDLKEDTDIEFYARPPVVTIMGHVDHGKTSLLDAMRSTNVVSGEAGGITQHIGAYQTTNADGKTVTFIDTPGHAAFTEMRARGANCTDIVIIVVAADDGIKDQTVEAINHAKAAKVPIIVAINKIDKPEADPQRVKNELLRQDLVVEDMGGDILCVEVSAKEKINLEGLMEAILLQAEILDLKAPVDRNAVGVVVESRLDRGRGPVATVLLQKGTLQVGDVFVSGTQFGRVRAMINDKGDTIQEAKPAMPVEIIGYNGVPGSGDSFMVLSDEARTKQIAEFRLQRQKEKMAAMQDKLKRQNLFTTQEGDRTVLNVVIKSDAHGSSEAISSSLIKINSEEVEVKIAHMGVGEITESDISLAMASNALILGFNVRANSLARGLAEKEGVEIRYYSIIYDLIDDVKAVLTGLLSPIQQEKFIGKAEIKQVFKISRVGTIAGCYVTEGVVKRGSKVRLLRDNVVIHEGSLKTLKRFKDEVKEVRQGYECGMAFENYNDLREGDFIECSEIEEIARTLS